jgi:hypothetical protein
MKGSVNPFVSKVFERLIKNVDLQIEETAVTTIDDSSLPLWQKALKLDQISAARVVQVSGDVKIRKLRWLLRIFTTLTTHQFTFSELYIQAILPYAYGADFKKREVKIKADNLIDELYQFALVCCPRRWGKTWFTAWFVACVMVCLPGITVTVFSPGKRQTGMFMKLVKGFMDKIIKETGWDIVIYPGENNQETFAINVDGTYKSLLRGLPAKENTTRGVDGNLIICEEAASMRQEFIEQVVLPVVGPSSTAMICISTIQTEDKDGLPNWYTQILNLRHPTTGLPLFNVYQFILACDECVRAKLAHSCKHKISELPSWHDEGKQDILELMYGVLNAGNRRLAELIGLTKSSALKAFSVSHIQLLFNDKKNPRINPNMLDNEPHVIFVTMDPAAGGEASEGALCSAIYEGSNMIIVGLESVPTKVITDYEDVFIKHLLKLREIPKFKNTRIVCFPENNLSALSRSLHARILAEVPDVQICDKTNMDTGNFKLHEATLKRHKTDDTGGLKTTGLVKEAMYHRMKEALALKSVHFLAEGLSVYSTDKDKDGWKINLEKLRKQLTNFEVKLRVPKVEDRAWADIKYTYSGKSAGPDDLAMATMLNGHWSYVYRINSHNFQQNAIP